MAKDSSNVRVGYSGSVYVGDVGAAAPVTPTATWDVDDWTEMGHISDDGITEGASQDIAEFFAWGFPSSPVRTQVTSEESTFALTFIETTAQVLSIFHGVSLGSMTSTAATGVAAQFTTFTKGAASTPDVRALGIDIVDGTRLQRIIIPRVQVTDRGDLSYKTDELLGYQVTFKALLAANGTAWQRMVTSLPLPA